MEFLEYLQTRVFLSCLTRVRVKRFVKNYKREKSKKQRMIDLQVKCFVRKQIRVNIRSGQFDFNRLFRTNRFYPIVKKINFYCPLHLHGLGNIHPRISFHVTRTMNYYRKRVEHKQNVQ